MKHLSIAALPLVAIALVNILAQYLGNGSIQSYLLNSDTLFWPALLSDTLANGGRFLDWSLPPAPYFFPDVAILLVAYFAGLGPHLQLLVVAVVQTMLVFVALWLLAKRTATPHPLLSASFIVTTLCFFALSSNNRFDFASSGPFVLMLVSVFHFGIFIASLFVLDLWLMITDPGSGRKGYRFALALLAILLFLSTISDSFFITQTVIPLIATALGQALLERRAIRHRLRISLLIVLLASVAGFFGDHVLAYSTTRPSPHFGLDGSWQRAGNIAHIFLSVTTAYPIFIIVFLSYGIVVAKSIRGFLSAAGTASKFDWLSVFSLLSVLSTIVALLGLTNVPVIGARYLIPLFFWPVIVVILFLSRHVQRWFVPATVTLSVAMMTPLTVGAYELFRANKLDADYYPREIACIDDILKNTGARNGLAQYWDARYLQTFSKLKLDVAQYSTALDPMPFFTSRAYFRRSYDFAISSGHVNRQWIIPVDALVRVGGQPAMVKQCGSKTVYVYAKGRLHPR